MTFQTLIQQYKANTSKMKKLLSILAAFVGLYSFGQVNYVGSGTTAQIDGLNVPSGRSALIYNSTLSQYGFENSASLWYWLITEADIDTFAELNAIVADATLAKSGDNISIFTNDSGYITSETDDQTAAEVSISDAGNIITATDVEGALQENRTAIDLNTAKVTNATHTGEVTGSGALTIASGVVDSDNIVNGTIDETDLDTSVNASLDLADGSLQKSGGTMTGDILGQGVNLGNSSTGYFGNIFGVNHIAYDVGVSDINWLIKSAGGDLTFLEETGQGTNSYGTNYYSLAGGGVPTSPTDLIDKAYADANYGSGDGDVVGPASATNNAIARFDTTTGKLLQNSGVTIDDSGNVDATGVVESASIIVGDGATDRTSDINAALTAYDHAYLIGDVVSTSAITLGDNQRLIGPGTLTNNTTDVLVIDGTNVQVELGAISSNAGNLITFTDNTFTFGLRNTKLSALNTGKSQIYLRGATGVYDMVVEGCYFETGPSHTVPMIDVVVTGENFNGNKFVKNTFQTNGTPGAEVIHLETTAASNWIYDNTISYNLFEIPNAGAVHLYSAAGTKMEGNAVYDLTTATDDLFVVDNTTGGLNSYGTIFRDYHRIGGSLSTFHDFANRGHYANNISIENPMGTAAAQLAFDAVSGHRFVGGAYISDYGGAILNDQVDASGFSGNLTTSDDTLQEIANAVDALSTGGGSGDVTAAANFGTDNVLIRSDGTLKGVQSTTVSVDDNGNLLQNANGSSTAAPRTFGVTNYSTGEAVRWQFGDATNTIENNWGNGTAISSFHTLVLAGGHEGLESGQVNWASNTFATDANEGLRVALKEDRKAVFWTRNNAARTQPFLEFQDFAGSVVASVDASGNITTTGTVDGVDISALTGTDVALADAGAYFTTDNVEAATQELAADVAGKVDGTISGRTSVTAVTAIGTQTVANYLSDGVPSAGEWVGLSDATPEYLTTSATFNFALLDEYNYDDSATDAATITFSNMGEGHKVRIKYNRASAPTYSGETPTQLPNTFSAGSWPANDDVEAVYYKRFGTVYYFFKEL